MIKLTKLFLVLVLFSIPIANAGSLDEYLSTIGKKCPMVNSLIIKKSLIELTKNLSCEEMFTSLLLKQCSALNCSTLKNSFASYNSSNQGAVVGQ